MCVSPKEQKLYCLSDFRPLILNRLDTSRANIAYLCLHVRVCACVGVCLILRVCVFVCIDSRIANNEICLSYLHGYIYP